MGVGDADSPSTWFTESRSPSSRGRDENEEGSGCNCETLTRIGQVLRPMGWYPWPLFQGVLKRVQGAVKYRVLTSSRVIPFHLFRPPWPSSCQSLCVNLIGMSGCACLLLLLPSIVRRWTPSEHWRSLRPRAFQHFRSRCQVLDETRTR